MFLLPVNLFSSSFDLIYHVPLLSLVGPQILLSTFLSNILLVQRSLIYYPDHQMHNIYIYIYQHFIYRIYIYIYMLYICWSE